MQCVDCVREAARSAPVARTVFGGRAATGATVTKTIIGITVGAFVLQLVGGSAVTFRFEFIPAYAVAEPWRFLTSAFLHLTSFPLHILFNMYAVWLVGPYLENLLGRARFAALYLISAFGGSVGFFVLAPATIDAGGVWWGGALGASGAVFGLFAALLLVNRHLGRDTAGIIGIVLINGALGFFVHSIAWQAHLGGFITGAALAAVLTYRPQRRRGEIHLLGMAAVAVGLILLVIVKAASVPAGLLL
ncbi:MAG: rhomboid family intramembrane serine protease [Kineosporiaceae bacterium]